MPEDKHSPEGFEQRYTEGEVRKGTDVTMTPLTAPVPGGIPGAPMDSIRPTEVPVASMSEAPTPEAPRVE